MSAHLKSYSPPTGGLASGLGSRGLWALGGLGLVVGATSAAAKNIRLVKDGKLESGQAVGDTLKEAVGAGVTIAAAGAAAGALGLSGGLGVLGVAALGVGIKYLWDSALTPSVAAPANAAGAQPAKPPKPKAAAAKAAKPKATALED